MRNKLFTASVDKMLFKQYPLGDELEKQKVVAKIFNPYGDGHWYLLNSDPEDPDYIWAIVSMFGNVEIGSVSRSELLGARIRPFGLPLERDLYFTPKNAAEVYRGLLEGKFYEKGGYMAEGGEIVKERNGKLYREEWAGSNRWLEVDSQFKMTKDEHEAKAFQENLNGNYESRDNHKHIAATLSGEPIQLQEHHNRYMAKGGKIPMIKEADIQVGKVFELINGEVIEIKRLFAEPRNMNELWAEFVFRGETSENSVNYLKNFINAWRPMQNGFAKGGKIEYIHKHNDLDNLYYKRYNGAIGSFAWLSEKKYNEGIIYPFDNFDMQYYSHLKLKPNEVLLRYRTDRMIGDVKYIVKFNLEKSLIYFMDTDKMSDDDDKNIIFQGRGIPMEYMVLDWDKLYPSQQMNVNYAKGGEMAEGGAVEEDFIQSNKENKYSEKYPVITAYNNFQKIYISHIKIPIYKMGTQIGRFSVEGTGNTKKKAFENLQKEYDKYHEDNITYIKNHKRDFDGIGDNTIMNIYGMPTDLFIITFEYKDGGENKLGKSRSIEALDEDEAEEKFRDQFHAFEGVRPKIISVQKLADGGMMAKGGEISYDKLTIALKSKLVQAYGIDRAISYLDQNEPVSPFDLVRRAIYRGYMSIEDVDARIFATAEETVSEYADMEEIGSSDYTFILKSFLESCGIKTDFKDNKLVVVGNYAKGGISDSDREKSIAELKRKIKHFREVEKSEPMARYYEEALFYMTEGKENDILKRGKYAKGGITNIQSTAPVKKYQTIPPDVDIVS